MDLHATKDDSWANLGAFGETGSAFDIYSASIGNSSITVNGDASAYQAGDYIVVYGSAYNDGTYQVVSATYGAGTTEIVLDHPPGNEMSGGSLCRTKIPEAGVDTVTIENYDITDIPDGATVGVISSSDSVMAPGATVHVAYYVAYEASLSKNSTGTIIFDGGGTGNLGTVTADVAYFDGYTQNQGTVNVGGGAYFRGASSNTGTVNGNAYITSVASSQGGIITGNVFNHNSFSVSDNADWGWVYFMSTGAAITGVGAGAAFDGFGVGLLVPQQSDVRANVQYNDGLAGTCAVPAAANVRAGVPVGASPTVGTLLAGPLRLSP